MDNMVDYPTQDYDYPDPREMVWPTGPNQLIKPTDAPLIKPNDELAKSLRLLYASAYSVALVGLLLNVAVIWLFRKKPEQKLSGRTKILGLAITHLVRCLFLPLYLSSAYNHFSWAFGSAACKLGSYVTFANMFSAALLLTFWHVRRHCCVVPPPTWLTKLPAGSAVLLSWFLGAVLATPSLLSRETQGRNDGTNGTVVCVDNWDQKNPSPAAVERMKAVMVCRVLFGLVFPIMVIMMCRLKQCGRPDVAQEADQETSDTVLWPVTFSHFLCWAPVLLLSVIQVTSMRGSSSVFSHGLPVCTVLHVFNSCICPLICLWKGKREADTRRTQEDIELETSLSK